MVDWLEELLAAVDGEDEGGQEDALALTLEGAASPAPPPVPEAGAGGRRPGQAEEPERPWDTAVPALRGDREERADSRGGGLPGDRRLHESGPLKNALDALGPLRDGCGHIEQEPGTAGFQPGETAKAGAKTAGTAEAGLERLYRQTVQAARTAAQDAAGGQPARTGPAEDPGRTAALTVDELDRAVKRDSRRYDGGMSIF